MKRLFAVLIALALTLSIPLLSGAAAGSAEKGELLITQEPEKKAGAVGEIVTVNFYLYPNLPEGRKLDSLSGTMTFDPEFVTLGAVNQTDEEQNLTSLMKGKASMFQYNVEDGGVMRFTFIDAYGVDKEGFWFQAEFRIEKEGATDFVFNGISYTGLDSSYQTVSLYIDPVHIGGIYTEGQEIPDPDGAEETFAPLTPAIETQAPVTPTPRPSSSAQPVPIASSLPTYSAKPTASGIVTPQPPVTSIPMTTPAPGSEAPETSVPKDETPAPAETPETVQPVDTAEPVKEAEASAIPIEDPGDEEPTPGVPVIAEETTAPTEPNQPPENEPNQEPTKNAEKEKQNSQYLLLIFQFFSLGRAIFSFGFFSPCINWQSLKQLSIHFYIFFI